MAFQYFLKKILGANTLPLIFAAPNGEIPP
jgi:hypothetical protein